MCYMALDLHWIYNNSLSFNWININIQYWYAVYIVHYFIEGYNLEFILSLMVYSVQFLIVQNYMLNRTNWNVG